MLFVRQTIKKNGVPGNQAQALRARQCPGAVFQRVGVGSQAKVYTQFDRLKEREQPARSGKEQGWIDPGTMLKILVAQSAPMTGRGIGSRLRRA